MDPDGMHPWVLTELAYAVKTLSIIFEKSWRMGEVPDDWRNASVTPISKKEKENLENYHSACSTSIPKNTGLEGIIRLSLHLPFSDKAVHGRGKKTLLPFSQGINNRRDH